MPGVVAQRNRVSIGGAHPAVCTQDQILAAPDLFRVPAHAHVLCERKEVAARLVEQHVLGQREFAGWPFGTEAGVRDNILLRVKNIRN
jgi:hypothetical protein